MLIDDYIRKLSERLVKAKHCWFVHAWTKWETQDVKRFYVSDPDHTWPSQIQTRRCLDCGLTQRQDLS